MTHRIELPGFKLQPDAKVHPYPFRIGIQTLQFLHGYFVYYALADSAAGKQFASEGGLEAIEKQFVAGGLSDKNVLDEGWTIMKQYQPIFETVPFQNALITLNSQWDWFIRKLGGFVEFSRTSLQMPPLHSDDSKNLRRIGNLSIIDQIGALKISSECDFSIDHNDLNNLKEMTLLRNIGIHNRWEVDDKYLEHSAHKEWKVGEIRAADYQEMARWHASLMRIINLTSKETAIKFKPAPPYER